MSSQYGSLHQSNAVLLIFFVHFFFFFVSNLIEYRQIDIYCERSLETTIFGLWPHNTGWKKISILL